MDDWPAKQLNIARYVFLHPAARGLFDDWHNQVRTCVYGLRALAGMEPDAPDLTQLVGELLLKSIEFARMWERYDVKGHTYGHKTFHHPEVGDLTLGYQTMQLQGTPGQCTVVYYAEAGTPEHDALALLDLVAAESEHAPRHSPTGNPTKSHEHMPSHITPSSAQPPTRTPVGEGSSPDLTGAQSYGNFFDPAGPGSDPRTWDCDARSSRSWLGCPSRTAPVWNRNTVTPCHPTYWTPSPAPCA